MPARPGRRHRRNAAPGAGSLGRNRSPARRTARQGAQGVPAGPAGRAAPCRDRRSDAGLGEFRAAVPGPRHAALPGGLVSARDGGARLARVGDTRGQRVVRAAGRGGGRRGRRGRVARWLAADARHRRAWARWRRWAASSARCKRGPAWPRWNGLPPAAAAAPKILSLAAGTGGLTAAGLPWRAWTSDLSAGIGQTRVAALDDGSLLTLNTGSAADVRFSDALRLIVLRQGELHIATYRDAMTPARPWPWTRRWVACSRWAPATWCACTTTASGWW